MRLKLTAKTIKRILQAYYCDPKIGRYVFLSEVQMINSTIADGLLVECWGDNMRTGFEIKISRSDFRKELKQPRKREMIVGMTNHFYFVTPERMLNKDEIPKDSGLIEISPHSGGKYRDIEGYKVKVKKKAPWTRAEEPTGLWENLLRKAWGQTRHRYMTSEIAYWKSSYEELQKQRVEEGNRVYRLELLVKKYKEKLGKH